MKLLLLTPAALMLLASTALAVPAQLAHQGRLLDLDGAPLDGEHDLTFGLFDADEDGTEVWSETVTVDMVGGFYSVVLGADETNNPLDATVLAIPPLWLELVVDDGEPLAPRHQLLSVPYAVLAGTAENVEGGYVDATDISVDGETVIDSTGTWVGATPAVDWSDLSGVPSGMVDGVDADVLAGLSCADQGVAKFDQTSGLWACGTDDVLTSGDVLSFVDGATIALGAGSSMAGTTLATVTDLDWTLLTSVPAGFADDIDDDALATLGPSCLDGDRASWDAVAGVWVCAPEQVTLSRIDAGTATTGQVLTYDGTNVVWDTPASTTNPPCTLTTLNESFGVASVSCGPTAVALRTWVHFTQVTAGYNSTCGLSTTGSIHCWGSDYFGQATPPAGTFTQVAAGSGFTCGINAGGSLQCWGQDTSGQATPPAGTFTQVAPGDSFACGINAGGSLQCWGSNYSGEATPPAGTFTQVSAGSSHSCGINAGGTIQCWGLDTSGQSTPPAGTFTQVSAGSTHNCAVNSAGSVQCWGTNSYGQSTPPVGSFTQVSAGGTHTCGILAATGTAVCWGSNGNDQSSPP